MFFSIGLFGIFWLFGNLDFATVFSIAPYMNETSLTIIALLLLGGACAKSAQLLLGNWLPHSMEGKKNGLFLTCFNFILIFFLLISLYFYSPLTVYSVLCSNVIPTSIKIKSIPLSLSKEVLDPLIGNLLGDGS